MRNTFAFLLLACLLPAPVLGQARCRVVEVVVSPPDAQIGLGVDFPLVATAYNATGSPCDLTGFVWTSSNANVVRVDRNGVVRGVSAGSAVITARLGSGASARSGSASMRVVGVDESYAGRNIPGFVPVARRPRGPGYAAWDRQADGIGPSELLMVEPLRLVLVLGESRFLDFRAIGADGSPAARVPIIFSVDPGGERVIAVDSFGMITSLGVAGTATVRATVPGNARIQPVRIGVEVRSDSIRFNRTAFAMQPGTVETLSLFIPAQQRALNPAGLFQFRSSDPGVVRVNPVQPIVAAVAPGSARVTAVSAMYPEVTTIAYVSRRVARLRFSQPDSLMTIPLLGTESLRAAALGEDGQPVQETPLRWQVPDSTVVVFDPTTGTIRARRPGMTRIGVTAPGGRDSALVAWMSVRVVAGGIAAVRPNLTLAVGERGPLEVQMLDERRMPIGPATMLVWLSSQDSIVRVVGGQAVGVRPGRARLIARTPWDSSATVEVLVGPPR